MTPKRIVSIALTWSLFWLMFASLSVTVLALIDPDSIDEGEVLGAVFILGPMGILTGLAFAFLLSVASKRTKSIDLSLFSGAGVGSRGFCARPDRLPGSRRCRPRRDIGVALVFSGFGGVISIFWYYLALRWARV